MSIDTTATNPNGAAPFNVDQQAVLDRLVDLLIPASTDGRMPAASSLNLYGTSAGLGVRDRAVLESGLTAIQAHALARHGVPAAALTDADAMALVDAMRLENPAFVQAFMVQTVGRYLKHEHVLPLIGLPARPHWPQGHVVEEGDWSLIDVVRRRPKIYREV